MKKILILFILLAACNKPEQRACWKFNGKESSSIIEMGDFNSLKVYPNLQILLIQDSLDCIEIKGGENVIKFVKHEIIDGMLVLENTNKCGFLRNKKHKVMVEVHFSNLKLIDFQGSESMMSAKTIVQSNLNLEIKESSATVTLDLDVNECKLDIEPCYADYVISGKANFARFSVKGFGFGNAKDFVVQEEILCLSRTAGDIHLNGNTKKLKCETADVGNVYYTGSPEKLEWNDYGKGKLLQEP